MKNIKSNNERVLQGEEKNAVLRDALKQQGYSEQDIAVMLGQGKKAPVKGKKAIESARIIQDMSFRDFQPWQGGKATYDVIMAEGKDAEMDAMLDEMYPDGLTDNELNDLLWFDSDDIFEYLGINANPEKGIPDDYEYYNVPEEQSSHPRARRIGLDQGKKAPVKGKRFVKSSDEQMPNNDSGEGRVLEGEEKDAVLREALKQQGYNDQDIAVMLSQSKRR